jgi:hypothetical protein
MDAAAVRAEATGELDTKLNRAIGPRLLTVRADRGHRDRRPVHLRSRDGLVALGAILYFVNRALSR